MNNQADMPSKENDAAAPNPQETAEPNSEEEKGSSYYKAQKPLHHLPRGKNTWNPQIIKTWWFWPASVVILVLLNYLYPLLWDLLSRK
jgi:hypothetical protein